MSSVNSTTEVIYPESDGRPMGETDLHRNWMIRIFNLLLRRYRGKRAYVSSDLLVYYVEGDPRRFVVPDVFVVLGSEQYERRVYKVWEEGRLPTAVFEVTSRATKREDMQTKPDKYRQMGVQEMFLYDPTGDDLSPTLQGWDLQQDVQLEPGEGGELLSEALDLKLRVEDGELVLFDASSGQRLLSAEEAADLARAEAERRAEAAEAELANLRQRLRQQGH